MNTQQQVKAATVIGSFLGVLGLLTIGVGFGLGMGAQIIMNNGCSMSVVGPNSPCQLGVQAISGKPTLITLTGIASLTIGGGILYYIRQNVP